MVDLLFRAAPGTTDLVFGGEDYVAPIQKLYVSHELLLPPPLFAASVQVATAPIFITVGITLAPPTFSAAVRYDNRVTRYRGEGVAAAHQVANVRRKVISSEFGFSRRELGGTVLRYGQANQLLVDVASVAGVSANLAQNASLPWGLGQQLGAQATSVMETAAGRRAHAVAAWQLAVGRQTIAAVVIETAARRRARLTASWSPAHTQHRDLDSRFGASTRHQVRSALVVWQQARHPAQGREAWPPAIVQPPIGYTPSTALLFQCPTLSAPYVLFFGSHPCYLFPRAHVVVPLLRTYVTINSITLRRVEGDIFIPAYAFQMSLDDDSWTWSWSASVPIAALPLVQPGSSGEPVEVEALVNGVPYRLYAEGVVSQRQFAQERIAIKGRGKAAMLDAPYAPVLNFGNSEARTAQQLMSDVLTINGEGIGWALDWGLTDWLVPGGIWTNQGSHISAVLNIAQAAGGYVQPHNTDQLLRVLPRYPSVPWNWASDITPDFELPSAVVSVEGIEWTRKPDYNRVFVSGTANGVLGQVTRAGTAGDSLAPMVTDALITHADASRQRGLAILSDTGRQARVALTLPVLAATGLIKPGQFVRYMDGSNARLGLVRSTSLAWTRPKLRQTIAVETHV